jgi:ketosteroid isomerase-like protein
MKKLWIMAFSCFLYASCTTQVQHDKKSETAAVVTKPQAAEFADQKYAEIGKKMLADLSSGDIAGFTAGYADNAVYQWNNGDSLAGKPAIAEFWTKRRAEIINSLTFSNEIWLPIKVNQPQSVESPGVWALGWYQVNAEYKTGKKMVQWMHIDLHFNANNKIDRVIQYLDRVPINAAMTK